MTLLRIASHQSCDRAPAQALPVLPTSPARPEPGHLPVQQPRDVARRRAHQDLLPRDVRVREHEREHDGQPRAVPGRRGCRGGRAAAEGKGARRGPQGARLSTRWS